ncbi:MAG: DUF427 domain-containing protein [Inquilinus sp.]|uniref:DUF427 domain-containing protein n=1 Tax=Inquilinus sp. TaxID=1932117 RepID=UPI003F3D634B
MSVVPIQRPRLVPREKSTPPLVNLLASPKRIRAVFNGVTIADSRSVLVLRGNHFLPVYYFPLADVLTEALRPSDHHERHEQGGIASYWSIAVGDRIAADAAWGYEAPEPAGLGALQGHVAFKWSAVDAWFEEDEEVFVHARDPYARIDILQGSSLVEVRLDGEVIARSTRPVLLFETHLPTRYYLPPEDVRLDLLHRSDKTTRCPYKGVATYWSAEIAGQRHQDIAWDYLAPIPEAVRIAGLISFYPDAVDSITRDGEPVA